MRLAGLRAPTGSGRAGQVKHPAQTRGSNGSTGRMTKGWFGIAAAALAAGAMIGSASAQGGGTLGAVKQRGEVVCGVSTGVTGFSAADSQGKWTGLDVDVCRALAAAIFGSGDKVKF